MGKQTRIILEYVWCDSTGVYSKTMIIPMSIANPKSWDIKNDVSWIPHWTDDKKLIPSYWCIDPFRMKIMNDRQVNDTSCIIVLCNTDERNFEYQQLKAIMAQNNTHNKLTYLLTYLLPSLAWPGASQPRKLYTLPNK